MSSSPPPLLLLFLLFIIPFTSSSSSSTLAIIPSTSTVCSLPSSKSPQSILCSAISDKATAFPLSPNTSFSSLSSTPSSLCALRSPASSLLCWSPSFVPKRLYSGAVPFASIAAGDPQVAAFSAQNGTIRWWRADPSFPSQVSGAFTSLTSGRRFTCALSNSSARCWGSAPAANATVSAFKNASLSSLVAGDAHVCAIAKSGVVLCAGDDSAGQSSPPPNSPPFEFKALALGANHTCALRRSNGTVLCWGGVAGRAAGYYSPVNETSFEVVVAGGDLTCGLTTDNFTVVCWASNPSNLSVTTLQLPPVLPGVCVSNRSLCSCGPFPGSENLCAGSGVICNQCDNFVAQSPSISPVLPISPVPSPTPTRSSSRRITKGWLAFGIVGSVGAFAGLCTVLFCIWFGICHHKKVHNSVQPTITGGGGGNGGSQAVPTSGPLGGLVIMSPFTSPSGSKSRIFRRQGSRVMKRQRSGPSSFKDKAEEFSFSELAAATKDFAPECKIGAGSFGTVYKGKLPDGREVAIKRSEPGLKTKKYQEKESAFQSELAFLSRLHHKHLVGLVGYCEEKEERLLVYEYMKNGALFDHLHSMDDKNSPVLNSWKMRIKVLLDAARGIEYLHNYAVPPIIHRDIKSSNILLDANWVARVSDFGLSLMGPESENGHLSIKAAGTVGYMDPEYYGMQHLTVKSDVYGLGVVMLEVLTGKRAIFKEEDGSPKSVVDYAMPQILAGELSKIIDTRVAPPGILEAEALELVAYMAVHCLSLEGRERPSMNDVVSNLEGALALCQESRGSISSASVSLTSVD